MTHREICVYCLRKSGPYLDYPFEPDYAVFKVKAASQRAGRIFAKLFELKGEPKATFNCNEVTGQYYRNMYPYAVTRGWHCPPVQQPYFNTVSLEGRELR